MSDIAALGNGIAVHRLKALTGLNPVKLEPEEATRLQALMKEVQELRYRVPSGPVDEVYAEVKVGGQVVATLYNSGASVTSNVDWGRLRKLPSMGEGCTLTGPALAQLRAEEIAKALGGTISKAETAMTQPEWRARPPVTWTIDYERMARDERAAVASRETTAAVVRAQLEAGGEV